MQVLLHDSNEVPMMLERGFRISPGFVNQIAVTAQYVSKRTILASSRYKPADCVFWKLAEHIEDCKKDNLK